MRPAPLSRFIRAAIFGASLAVPVAWGLSTQAAPPPPAAAGDASQPSNAQLLQRLDALQAEVNQLRAQQAKYDSRDVDATVAAVLQDAQGRNALGLPPGGFSGHDLDKGFYIKSSDGNFVLYPDLLLQFRGAASYREKAKHGDDSTESGFEVRRAKIGFYGTAFSPDFSYRFLFQNSTTGGGLSVQYAWGQYLFAHHSILDGDLGVRAGQFKNIVFKEEFTPDRDQLFAERSLTNFLLGGASLGSETQGVDFLLTGRNTPLHAQILIDDGLKSSNTDFRDNQPVVITNPDGTTTTNTVATNLGVAGRVDYKLFGQWGDADDLTGVWGRDDLLVVGGGVDFSQGDHNNTLHYTVDVQYQWRHKLALLAALYGQTVDTRNTSTGNRTDYGAEFEAGYFLTRAVQPIVRYSLVKFDRDFKVGGADTFHEIAAGVNWFFGADGQFGNRAKLTFDLSYYPNGSPAFAGGDVIASPNKRDELVFRSQLQLSL